MKLRDDFFRILAAQTCQDQIEYSIRLDSGHSIYRDHFPGNPVTPGVCIIQTVKELSEENLNRALFLHRIARVRYFKAINPVDNEIINVSLNISEKDGYYNVNARVFADETVFAQLSMIFGSVSV
ncbi:MAG: hypothetical protein LBK58_15040 [Prevotellaceae bacterium]|jgi:3-hydroxyacyl-[acyl-carrier-protein] dehydratase|nr:hypothetical protein [Prevotellaceae bacterium]